MTDLRIDLELQPKALGLDKLTHLRIEIDHDKGGLSWGTGDYHSCGVVCNVHPIEKQDFNGHTIIGRVYDGKTEHQGFFVFLIPCGRKSPKKMQLAFDKVKPHAEEIKDLFLAKNYVGVANLLTNIKYV